MAGFASSIAGLIALTDLVATKAWAYYHRVKEKHQDLQVLGTEATALRAFLTVLHEKITDDSNNDTISVMLRSPPPGQPTGLDQQTADPSSRTSVKADPQSYLRDAEDTLRAIDRLLNAWTSQPGAHVRNVLKSASWPFKSPAADSLLARLRLHRESFAFALTVKNSDHARRILCELAKIQELLPTLECRLDDIHESIPEFRKVMTSVLDDTTSVRREQAHLLQKIKQNHRSKAERSKGSKQQKMFLWLSALDSEASHKSLRNIHEPGTSHWLIETREFQRWVRGDSKVLWLHGIPGAGKTLLTFHAIEELKSLCRRYSQKRPNSKGIGLAYHYFDFRRAESQNPSTMLSAIVRQLWEQRLTPETFQVIERAFDEFTDRSGTIKPPTVEALTNLLFQLVKHYDKCFLVIDGLDECPRAMREETYLPILLSLAFAQISEGAFPLLISSRRESDIQRALNGSTQIAAEGDSLSADLTLHVQRSIAKHRNLNRLSGEFQIHLQRVLVEKACGMFRWIECQLYTLAKLRTERAIREALAKDLPVGLRETYDRIVSQIVKEDREIAQKTLHWLTYSSYTLSIPELLEAIATDIECDDNDGTMRIHLDDILEICGCLVHLRVDWQDQPQSVELAHYTVKEYILTDNCGNGLQFLHASTSQAHAQIAGVCLRSLTLRSLLTEPWTSTSKLYKQHDYDNHHDIATDILRFLSRFPLYEYAARRWLYHYHAAKPSGNLNLVKILIGIDVTPPFFELWQKFLTVRSAASNDNNYNYAELGITNANDYREVFDIEDIDQSDTDFFYLDSYFVTFGNSYRGSSMQAACFLGLGQLCQEILLYHRATNGMTNDAIQNSYRGLLIALENGHIDIAMLILEEVFPTSPHQISPKGLGGFDDATLSKALRLRETTVATGLLKSGIVPSTKNLCEIVTTRLDRQLARWDLDKNPQFRECFRRGSTALTAALNQLVTSARVVQPLGPSLVLAQNAAISDCNPSGLPLITRSATSVMGNCGVTFPHLRFELTSTTTQYQMSAIDPAYLSMMALSRPVSGLDFVATARAFQLMVTHIECLKKTLSCQIVAAIDSGIVYAFGRLMHQQQHPQEECELLNTCRLGDCLQVSTILDDKANPISLYSYEDLMTEAALFGNAELVHPILVGRNASLSSNHSGTVIDKMCVMIATGIANYLTRLPNSRGPNSGNYRLWMLLSELGQFSYQLSTTAARSLVPTALNNLSLDAAQTQKFADFPRDNSVQRPAVHIDFLD